MPGQHIERQKQVAQVEGLAAAVSWAVLDGVEVRQALDQGFLVERPQGRRSRLGAGWREQWAQPLVVTSPWQVELCSFDPQEAVVDNEVITQPVAMAGTGGHEDDGAAVDALLPSGCHVHARALDHQCQLVEIVVVHEHGTAGVGDVEPHELRGFEERLVREGEAGSVWDQEHGGHTLAPWRPAVTPRPAH